MEIKNYLKVIKEEIHSVVVATLDQEGHPVTRVIDMMLYDEDSLYFLTAKGKEFYQQLMEQQYISLSGMTGEAGSMSKKAVSLSGWVCSMGKEKLDDIFKENSYMAEIYPTQESREALEVFRIYRGQGNYFDLSTKPITRGIFSLGETAVRQGGYEITQSCTGCRTCFSKCPQNCIEMADGKAVIQQEHCLHCGNCMAVCPHNAVERR